MYRFHYFFIKKLFPGDLSQLCFTDTDSFLYLLKTNDFYSTMLQYSDLFDFSDYPVTHSCFANLSTDEINNIKLKNKKVIGKFKDELSGEKMLEFVGLRSKMYSFYTAIDEIKKLKGIKSSVVKKLIHFCNYKDTLESSLPMRHTMTTFLSKEHLVSTVIQNKMSLSCFDDKRYILDDGIRTLAHGHYKCVNI